MADTHEHRPCRAPLPRSYVLSYAVIMLNTDHHNSQVKNKMTFEAFCRNLRGVNDNQDFEAAFLQACSLEAQLP